MNSKTTDGFLVTTIEQNGSLTGQEIGRVFLMRRHGYDYWGVGSVARARELVNNAKTQTSEEFRASADAVETD